MSITPTVAQVGYMATGVWNESNDPILATPAPIVGLRYGPLPRSGNQTAYLYRGATLTLTTGGLGGSGTLTVGVVVPSTPQGWPTFAPTPWSTTNPPSGATVATVATATIPATSGTPMTLSLDLGALGAPYRRPGWDGYLYFTVTADPQCFLTRSTPLILTGEVPIESGRQGYRNASERLHRCDRCGFTRPVNEMVEDGWARGSLVCSSCYDPGEPPPRPARRESRSWR
jgi:hypothetical protein